MAVTPSLLWLPPRGSGNFQRFPHAETNFLDLSIDRPGANTSSSISQFIHQCHARSHFQAVRSQTDLGALAAQQQAESSSILEFIPYVAAFFFVGAFANEYRPLVLHVLCSRFCWFWLSLGVMYVALSGLLHSIIHGAAPFYYNVNYGFLFVHPGGRRQFLLEGLLHGGWSFVVSLAALGLSEALPGIKSVSGRELLIQIALIAIVVSYVMVHLTFIAKNRWMAM